MERCDSVVGLRSAQGLETSDAPKELDDGVAVHLEDLHGKLRTEVLFSLTLSRAAKKNQMLQSFAFFATVRTASVWRRAVRESVGERKQSTVLHMSDDMELQLRWLDGRMSAATSL